MPIILLITIEFSIWLNLSFTYFSGSSINFIGYLILCTVQLGATVDYAILMTTRYKTERNAGKDKHEAVTIALSTSMKSIMVSALGFFASTFGVGVYSSVDMISQLCTLMSRGAIISMITVICILPSMLMLFDKVIINTTMGMKKKENKLYKLPEIN
jgi:predicted RND superfamily exporter protein